MAGYPETFRRHVLDKLDKRPAWQSVESFAAEQGVHWTSIYKWIKIYQNKPRQVVTCNSSAKQAVEQRLAVVEKLMTEHMSSYQSLHSEQYKLVSALTALS